PQESTSNRHSQAKNRSSAASLPQLEAKFESQLQSAWTVRVHRMQEGAASKTVCAPGEVSAGGIARSAIATDGVAASISQVWIIDAELRVVEHIKRFRAELHLATLPNRKVL